MNPGGYWPHEVGLSLNCRPRVMVSFNIPLELGCARLFGLPALLWVGAAAVGAAAAARAGPGPARAAPGSAGAAPRSHPLALDSGDWSGDDETPAPGAAERVPPAAPAATAAEVERGSEPPALETSSEEDEGRQEGEAARRGRCREVALRRRAPLSARRRKTAARAALLERRALLRGGNAAGGVYAPVMPLYERPRRSLAPAAAARPPQALSLERVWRLELSLAASVLPPLRSLALNGVILGAGGAAALAHGGWPALRALELRGCRVGAVGAAALIDAGTLRLLRRLDLGGNCLGPEGAAALAAARFAQLQDLSVAGNGLGGRGIGALAAADWAPWLHTLDARFNTTLPLEEAAWPANALAGARLHRLRDLWLGGNARLDLSACWIDAAGAAALVQATWTRHLQALDLSDNARLGAGGAAVLAASRLPALRVLRLLRAGLGEEGVAALCQAHWPCIEQVSVEGNGAAGGAGAGLRAARKARGQGE